MLSLSTMWTNTKNCIVRNAPQIMIYGGMAGMTGAGVIACIKTKNVGPAVEAHKLRMADLGEDREIRDLIKEYARLVWEFTKIYIIPVSMLGVSAFSICKGTGIFSQRLADTARHAMELSAAYGVLEESNNKLRAAIREKYGEDAEMDLMTPTVNVETVEEDGKKKKVKVYDDTLEPFAFYYMTGVAPDISENFDYRMVKARQVEHWARLRCKAIGYLNWNEVREEFKAKWVDGGHGAGWVWDYTKDDSQLSLNPQEAYHWNPYTNELERCILIRPNLSTTLNDTLVRMGYMEVYSHER